MKFLKLSYKLWLKHKNKNFQIKSIYKNIYYFYKYFVCVKKMYNVKKYASYLIIEKGFFLLLNTN